MVISSHHGTVAPEAGTTGSIGFYEALFYLL